jgi:DNA-binding IscR family transcriptional regulator
VNGIKLIIATGGMKGGICLTKPPQDMIVPEIIAGERAETMVL